MEKSLKRIYVFPLHILFGVYVHYTLYTHTLYTVYSGHFADTRNYHNTVHQRNWNKKRNKAGRRMLLFVLRVMISGWPWVSHPTSMLLNRVCVRAQGPCDRWV